MIAVFVYNYIWKVEHRTTAIAAILGDSWREISKRRARDLSMYQRARWSIQSSSQIAEANIRDPDSAGRVPC